jgi:hypothetical protein
MAHPPTAPTPAHPAGPGAGLDDKALHDADARHGADDVLEERSFDPRPAPPPPGVN